MIWGCFSANGKSNLASIKGTLDSVGYCTLLEKIVTLFAEDKYPDGWIFQQDNASIHTSNHTKQFFSDMDIWFMDCSARNPDLNPIENISGYYVTKIYNDFRQFDDLESVSKTIAFAWDSISIELLKKLVRSMPKRCSEVVENQGKRTHY